MMLPPIYSWLKASNAVKSLIGNLPRAYRHDSAPQDVPAPYVTWSLVSVVPENNVSELPNMDRLSVQIDCWSETDTQVETLAKAVRDAIEPHAHMTSVNLNTRDVETMLYRIGLQFDVLQAR